MIRRGFGKFRARLADRRARLPLGFQMIVGVGSLLALSVLASIAAALVVVGVAHAARNDERGVPYRNAVDVAALNAKGIANDERGYLLSGDPTFIVEARERTGWRARWAIQSVLQRPPRRQPHAHIKPGL
jgi:methyl-accepting chemotaxis protein